MSKKNRKKNRKGAVPRKVTPSKLTIWQRRLAESNLEYSGQEEKINHREMLYEGDDAMKPMVKGQKKEHTPHVRNIIFENIESQVSSSIPQPKVSPRRKEDEHLAQVIENMERNELDRLPFETMNDMAERTVPMHGGVGYFVEWDETKRTHNTSGEVTVTLIHPKQFAPQPGIYTSIQDMDWFILKIPTTKNTVRRKYGVNVYAESESEPGIRGIGNERRFDEALTQYIGFERNDTGGIDRYSWVNDIELEDLTNYQQRRQPVCSKCGRAKPLPGQIINNAVKQGNLLPDPGRGFGGTLIDEEMLARNAAGQGVARAMAEAVMAGVPGEEGALLEGLPMGAGTEPEQRYDGGPCPYCGSKEWESREMEYEEVMLPMQASGKRIPGMHPGLDADGNPVMVPTKIPFYKPDMYPIVLQRSVSKYGQLFGNSDVDVIEDQQNTTNRIEKKIIDRLWKAGSRITLPNKACYKTDPVDGERWFIENPADKNMISLLEFKGNLQYELMYLSQVYEEARQILGITDSFQGRVDPTATSGKAKEFSAAQAAGRLESKRVMKQAAYADVYQLIFKYMLAYADEPRTVTYRDQKGEMVYDEFNRYDFLEQDADGQYYWNDQFLFSCDTAGPLASNREAMWQETRLNLQTGAFGDPKVTQTLILFWTKMELLHYPGAGDTKRYLEEKLKEEQEQAKQMQQMQMQMQLQQLAAAQNQQVSAPGAPGGI